MGEVTHPRVICTSGLTFTGEPQTRLNQESEDLGSSFVLEKEKKKKKKKAIRMGRCQHRPIKCSDLDVSIFETATSHGLSST